jgi:hypothetical protein
MRTQSDMNKQSLAYRESNDCTVRANAHAFNISYGKAHRHLIKFGRPRGSGPTSTDATLAVLDMADKLGHTAVERDDLRDLTLNQFYKQYASKGGAWVIFIKGHAVGFRDGMTTDWTGHETTGEIVRRKTAKIGYRAHCACVQIIEN